jgi:mannose-6-phosphate isomerase-like protein (cupin superfamily)
MIVKPEEARVYKQGLGEIRMLVDGEQTDGKWWLLEGCEFPGFTTSLHFHPKTTEQFYVLEGVMSVYVDDKWLELGPGTFAELPPNTIHAQANHSEKNVRFLATGIPAGFDKFFPELDKLATRMPPSDPGFVREASKLVSQFDTTVLGPPPAWK